MEDMVDKNELRPLLASNVKRLREKLGLSQDDLAEKIGVSRATINRIEREHHVPEFDVICNLADALGVSTEIFRRNFRIPAKSA